MLKALKPPINYLADIGLLTATISCSRWWLESGGGLDSNTYVAGALVSGGWLVSRWIPSPNVRTNYAHSFRQSMGLVPIRSTETGRQSYHLRWKPEADPDEFEFFGLGLSVRVLESELARFLRFACKRQNNALRGGGRLGIYGTGTARIHINWVLSENFFCNRLRPRKFPKDKFWAILTILGYTRLICGDRKQGQACYLMGEYSVATYVEIAIQRWLKLTAPSPRRNLSNGYGVLSTLGKLREVKGSWGKLREVKGS